MSPQPDIEGISDSAVIDFGRRYGLVASGDFPDNPQDVFEKILSTSINGNPQDGDAILEVFHSNVHTYLMDTKQATMLNDVANTNQFLGENMSSELTRTMGLRDKTFNHIHKTRQRYFGKKYAINANRFWARVLQITIFVVLLIAVTFALAKVVKKDVSAFISMKTAYIIVGVIVSLYVLILVIFLKQNQIRRKDDWNKFYFTTPQDKASSGSCR